MQRGQRTNRLTHPSITMTGMKSSAKTLATALDVQSLAQVRISPRPAQRDSGYEPPEDPAFDATMTRSDTGRMLRTLLGNLDGMVYRCRDDDAWTMEFVSEGCRALTGYDPQDLLLNNRLSYLSLMHPEDRERVREEIVGGLTLRKRFDCEYRIFHANGGIRWVWERGTGVFDLQGRLAAIEGIIQDVTERKESSPARREQFMALVRARGSVSGFESQVYRKNGEIIWISENARAVYGVGGELACYEGTVEDITERKIYQARIEQQANYDTLTGLANRSLLNDRLQQAILNAASHGSRLAVVFVDLDRFKYINDSLGHHVGDELLRAMAERLRASVRESDTVARLGGDEFVLLINGQGDPESVAVVLERMLSDISQPWTVSQGDFNVTCSMGVALYPDDGQTAQALLKHADSAMYRAKEKGRNNFQFFTAELNALITERLELENKLRRALERSQFSLHYQPRVDMHSRRIVGAEALLRWSPADQETVPPSRFIPVAEEIGLIVPIGRWVLREACAQNKAWQDAGLPPFIVSVNVSVRQFRQDDIVQTISDVLRDTGLDARYLEIELTESAVMHDADQFIAMLNELNDLGVQISIDDFGTGYSSLSYLKRFPVDRLKVDRSFVQDIANDVDDATIVRTVIALGHNLGLKVVAEGVETEQQLAFLRANHCDELQGYYFGMPLPSEEFVEILRRNEPLRKLPLAAQRSQLALL
jgi:diguanylate cyclase (GGDEF)-like protein/PAS domain S-box-containing protein